MFDDGLIHKIKVYKIGTTKESGVAKASRSELTGASEWLLCRFTQLTAEEEQQVSGRGSEVHWKVIVEDTALMEDEDLVYDVKRQDKDKFYSVKTHKRQQDEDGNYHHVSLMVARKKK